jgi:hypothetical protein
MTRTHRANQPFSDEPRSGVRVSIDALVQASLVELFNAYGVAVAPLPRSSKASTTLPDVCAAAAFRNAADSGRVTLSLPSELLEHMKGAETTAVRQDWARELANQLVGRIKNRLLPFGIRLDIGALTLLDPKMLQHQLDQQPAARVYAGRSLRGPVLVTVQGLPHDSTLSYVGGVSAAEGAMLWL